MPNYVVSRLETQPVTRDYRVNAENEDAAVRKLKDRFHECLLLDTHETEPSVKGVIISVSAE